MASNAAFRRSARLQDPNGRQFLATAMGCSQSMIEAWITSPTVQPHLLEWHRLCISGADRYNEVAKMIDCGYYYLKDGFEQDMLLACLGEGLHRSEHHGNTDLKKMSGSPTEIWARTAWRIVNGNKGKDQAFDKRISRHSTACYTFAIDLLCLAFHSIAHRGAESCYEGMINGNVATTMGGLTADASTADLPSDPEWLSDVSDNENGTEYTSSSIDDIDDEDFVRDKKLVKKAQWVVNEPEEEDNITVAMRRVEAWNDGKAGGSLSSGTSAL